jgi:hypothetical protein
MFNVEHSVLGGVLTSDHSCFFTTGVGGNQNSESEKVAEPQF